MKKLFLASVMMTATMMTQAGAADMALKAARVAPIQYSDWSGFYVGIEGGYGWGRNRYDDSVAGLGSAFQGSDIARLLGTGTGVITNAFAGPSISTVNNNGFLGGGFFGAQKQYGRWVFGIEADIDAASLKGSAVSSSVSRETVVRGTFGNPTVTLTGPGVDIFITKCKHELLELSSVAPVDTKCIPKTVDLNDLLKHFGITVQTGGITVTGPLLPDSQTTLIRELATANVTRSVSVDTKIDLLSSVRGKVGFAAWDSVLLYGTGGLALAHGTNTVTVTQQTTLVGGTAFAAQSFTGSAGSTMFGWAAGGGIDFKWPGTGFVLGVEYLHYDFAKNTFAISDTGGVGRNFNAHQSVDAIKGRVSYLFPI